MVVVGSAGEGRNDGGSCSRSIEGRGDASCQRGGGCGGDGDDAVERCGECVDECAIECAGEAARANAFGLLGDASAAATARGDDT